MWSVVGVVSARAKEMDLNGSPCVPVVEPVFVPVAWLTQMSVWAWADTQANSDPNPKRDAAKYARNFGIPLIDNLTFPRGIHSHQKRSKSDSRRIGRCVQLTVKVNSRFEWNDVIIIGATDTDRRCQPQA
jgi:hypothetical protein